MPPEHQNLTEFLSNQPQVTISAAILSAQQGSFYPVAIHKIAIQEC